MTPQGKHYHHVVRVGERDRRNAACGERGAPGNKLEQHATLPLGHGPHHSPEAIPCFRGKTW